MGLQTALDCSPVKGQVTDQVTKPKGVGGGATAPCAPPLATPLYNSIISKERIADIAICMTSLFSCSFEPINTTDKVQLVPYIA